MTNNKLVDIDNRLHAIITTENQKNRKGDLFTRLAYDVLYALGFGDAQFDVQKPGRELDIIVKHRTENRVALVECKSKEEKIGGADINKFAGALSVEADVYERENIKVVGYFLSQSGFTPTALQQEKERGKTREIILLGPSQIVTQLICGKMLCSLDRAAEVVALSKDQSLQICKKVDLLASEYGWIWVLYYSSNPQQKATHFAFVHADGNRLLNSLAYNLIQQMESRKCGFSDLEYIEAPTDLTAEKNAAQSAYFQYLENELGEIQFEGMPTDKEAGAVKVNLESIFTPLQFIREKNKVHNKGIKFTQKVDIKDILCDTVRAAILAKPGGGKSTLIRRIALAYAFPDRRKKVDDGLPDRDFFPVYIRCRDLGNDAAKSIQEIIGTIVSRAEITKYAQAFAMLIEDALQAGRVLLLIDGLDEISNEQYRISFVNQLRTFTAKYPAVHLIVTSREAGFRRVAYALTSYCKQYTIAALRPQDINYLCLKWHEAILGKSKSTESEAKKVCNIILDDSRIVALAENPLLLTTLLFVKRWVGYLPTKKCHLYEEMIKLLLVTWNAVAHERLDIDETEPQLAFVAYHMTLDGQQKITRDKLEKYIIAARKDLPDVLGYTDISPSKFIDQVEERSSLLIQFGLEENENGQFVPSYEFSHLSFQEYLTALAITKNWISDANKTILEILQPHFTEEHWKEVIPMVVVLAGRSAKPILEKLIVLAKQNKFTSDNSCNSDKNNIDGIFAATHLSNCIASEVSMEPEILDEAILISVQRKESINSLLQSEDIFSHVDVFNTILKSKYGGAYRKIVQRELLNYTDDVNIYAFADSWIDICRAEDKQALSLNKINSRLEREDIGDKITGALLMMQFAYKRYTSQKNDKLKDADLHSIYKKLIDMMFTKNNAALYSASWCLAWSGYSLANLIPNDYLPYLYRHLINLWLSESLPQSIHRNVSWAVYSCCNLLLQIEEYKTIPGLLDNIRSKFAHPQNDFDKKAALFLGMLLKVWTNNEIEKYIKSFPRHEFNFPILARFLNDSGYDESFFS